MKKTISFLVALILTLSLAVMPTLAAEPAPAVVGYSASRIEKKDLTNIPCIQLFLEDKYSTATEFKISSIDDLKMFNTYINDYWQTFKGVTVYLENDLDLNGEAWKPLGYNVGSTGPNCFEGIFDGQGHVIDNFKVEDATSQGLLTLGFFGTVKEATIKNLIIGSKATVTYTGTTGDARTGGLVGCLATGVCTVDNCYVLATVSSATQYAGGICGALNGKESVIKNTTFAGNVTGAQRVGGILGYLGNTSMTIDNCRNTGTVTNTGSGSNCYTGGIVGMLNNKVGVCVVSNCINNGEIKGTGINGGISGMTRGNTTYEKCVNYGTVNNPSELFTTSGIFGAYYEDGDAAKQVLKEGNQNLMGQTDATLSTVPTITPNFYTGKCELPAEETTEADTTTAEPDTTTAEPDTTTAATTTAPTEEVTTGADKADEKGGCGSAIGGSVVILLAFGAAAVVSKKRK